MGILTVILVSILLVCFVSEMSHVSVYGWYLKDSEIEALMDTYLDRSSINPINNNILSFGSIYTYAAISNSILSGWYIYGYGAIPRWSKWHGVLTERRGSLLAKEAKKRLMDL